LDGRLDLVGLVLADQVGDGGVHQHELEGRHPTHAAVARQEHMADHTQD
jgi:hypothetical protein